MIYRYFFLTVLVIFIYSPLFATQQKIIIYKGNSPDSYSLPSLMLKALTQPDFLELPLLLTKDNIPVVYDDVFLHPGTNVNDIFPGRSRQDGKYYLIDFSLAEIEQLTFRGDSLSHNFTQHPISFADSLELISVLSQQIGETPQVLPLIKYPWFHSSEGKDISSIVLDILIARTGSIDKPLYLKCYDPEELQRIKKTLLPGLPVEFKLVQGIEKANGRETMRLKRGEWTSYNYDWLFTRLGLRVLSNYADSLSLAGVRITKEETLDRLITDSHALNMNVFIDIDDSQLTAQSTLIDHLLFTLSADGLAVSNPKILKDFMLTRQEEETPPEDTTTSGFDNEKDSSILSDPEALSRRLKNVK